MSKYEAHTRVHAVQHGKRDRERQRRWERGKLERMLGDHGHIEWRTVLEGGDKTRVQSIKGR